jgi:hypothetical protein
MKKTGGTAITGLVVSDWSFPPSNPFGTIAERYQVVVPPLRLTVSTTMETTQSATFALFLGRKITEIEEQMSLLSGKVRLWFSLILFETIPTLVLHVLESFIDKGSPSKSYMNTNPKREGEERRTYDLVDCGGRNCFTVKGPRSNIPLLVHNSASYGAGAKKWYSTFKLQGFNYTLEQCQQFHVAYWKLFQSIKNHEAQLLTQWEKNGGWLLDALGLPFCVDAYAKKDCINRKIQRSGHEILMVYQKIVADELVAANIPFTPWCWDFHDEIIVEVPKEFEEEASKLMGGICFDKLNALLYAGDTVVKLKGSGGPVATLAEAKLEG